MKVAQILPRMDIGGVERGVVDLAKYFKGKDIAVSVISSGGRLLGELAGYGAARYILPVHKKSLFSLRCIPRLKKLFISEEIDIVHGRSRVPAWLAFFATRNTNTHFITTAHGVYQSRGFSEVMGWGKFVICPSNVVARHMKENYGVPEEKIVVISRWVDLGKFTYTDYHQRSSSNSIVCIGRVAPSKGYEYLLEAFKKNVRANPYLTLKIVGSASGSKAGYMNQLRTLVTRYSLNYNVQFLGFRADVERVLHDARLLVAPSVIEESFGRVVIEAFACGVPVIATKVGGFAEIIEDGKDGILVPSRDPEALAEAIHDLLSDPAKAQMLSENARKKVQAQYSLPHCLAQEEMVYRKTMELNRILVIKISSLGDIVLIVPALKALKEHFSQSHVTVLTLKKYAGLFNDSPYVDKVIGLDDDYKTISGIIKNSRQLRRNSYDYIFDIQNSRVSHILSFLSFSRRSFGFARKLGFLLSSKAKLKAREVIDPLSSQEKILKLAGLAFKEKKLLWWDLPPRDISRLGLSGEKFIGINVSASSRWQTKNWPAGHIKKVIELIAKELPEYKTVLFGDQSAEKIGADIEAGLKNPVFNLCGKTELADLPYVLKKLEVFVTPDTATLHLAQALGAQVIALFGPTNPHTHTVPDKNLHVIHKKLECSYCYKPKCPHKSCMDKISANEVFSQIKTILGGK